MNGAGGGEEAHLGSEAEQVPERALGAAASFGVGGRGESSASLVADLFGLSRGGSAASMRRTLMKSPTMTSSAPESTEPVMSVVNGSPKAQGGRALLDT